MDNAMLDICVDTETGEILYPSQYNAETGEYEGTLTLPHKTKFRIPPTPNSTKRPHKLTKVTNVELELITAAIFLLPTMVLFYPVISLFMLVTEIILHNWAHKKNKCLRDDTFYYKSPLHGIVKEFCGRCKDINAKERITKIQDMRNDRMKKYSLESIRRVVT